MTDDALSEKACDLVLIRRYLRTAWRWADAYRKGLKSPSKNWKSPVGRSARHSKRAPSGAVWSTTPSRIRSIFTFSRSLKTWPGTKKSISIQCGIKNGDPAEGIDSEDLLALPHVLIPSMHVSGMAAASHFARAAALLNHSHRFSKYFTRRHSRVPTPSAPAHTS